MSSPKKLDLNAVLDGFGQGVLIFSSDGKLIQDNLAARTILGKDMELLRHNGWEAASTLFNTHKTDPERSIEAVRDRAMEADQPVRFFTYLNGEYIPCSAAAVQGDGSEIHFMVTLETPDWSAITTFLERFREEMQEAINATQGHVDIIHQSIVNFDPSGDVSALSKRISGFNRLVGIHMNRVGRLMEMLERLEKIRTGVVRDDMRRQRRRINLENFMEDLEEELDETPLVDPETDAGDHRSRLTIEVDPGLHASGSQQHLTRILHDILRNAIMYSMKATPISIAVKQANNAVQFDITDQGYGIREKESERVFAQFERAMQPQVMGEFGYGLSLYLCKYEVEAMNGRMWFESQEGVGTTFSMTLPIWQDEAASDSSDDDQT